MSSGDKRMNFYAKKFFHLNQVRDNFLGYLKSMIEATRYRIFPYAGLFNVPVLTSSVADTIHIAPAPEGMDAYGHEMAVGGEQLGTTLVYENVTFPNTNAVVYSVGMRWNDTVPSGIEPNVRTKAAEYALLEEVVGEVGAPDNVTLVISTPLKLRLNIDTLFISATPVNNSGRKAVAWLVDPLSQVEAVAIYEATVQWDGTHNYIEIPYTTLQGPLGQTSPDYPISMVTTDYQVWVEGVTVVPKSAKDLSVDDNYVFLGEVTGVGRGSIPTVFDVTGQKYLSKASSLATAPIAGSPHSEGTSDVQTVLSDILGWLNDHVTGNADLHSAGDVATGAISGSPDALAGGTVQGYFNSLLGWVNDRVLKAGDTMSGTLNAPKVVGGAGFSGAGNGIEGVGAAAFVGVKGTGGANADGVNGLGTGTGRGVYGIGGSTSGYGVVAQGGSPDGPGGYFEGVGSGTGIAGTGGATGKGVYGQGGTNCAGVEGTGGGNGPGVAGTGGATGKGVTGQGGTNYAGVEGTGGGSGAGVAGIGGTTGKGVTGQGGTNCAGVEGTGGGNGPGVSGRGAGTNPGVYGTGGATNGLGVNGQGVGTGSGVGGSGGSTSGPGVQGYGGSANGPGGYFVGAGTGAGVWGSAGGTGPGVKGNSFALDADEAVIIPFTMTEALAPDGSLWKFDAADKWGVTGASSHNVIFETRLPKGFRLTEMHVKWKEGQDEQTAMSMAVAVVRVNLDGSVTVDALGTKDHPDGGDVSTRWDTLSGLNRALEFTNALGDYLRVTITSPASGAGCAATLVLALVAVGEISAPGCYHAHHNATA